MNHNSSEFERMVRDASRRVRGHLSDVRESHGIDRDDVDYFNAETGRGASDDDILDQVRDLVFGDLLNIPDHCATDAADLSDAAAEAVHAHVLNEKLGSLT